METGIARRRSRLGKCVRQLPGIRPCQTCDDADLPHPEHLRVKLTLREARLFAAVLWWIKVLSGVIQTHRREMAELEAENTRLREMLQWWASQPGASL
jgi:hypothetical protein